VHTPHLSVVCTVTLTIARLRRRCVLAVGCLSTRADDGRPIPRADAASIASFASRDTSAGSAQNSNNIPIGFSFNCQTAVLAVFESLAIACQAFHAAARNMLCGRLAWRGGSPLSRARVLALSVSRSPLSLLLSSLSFSLSLSLSGAGSIPSHRCDVRSVCPCNVRSFSQRSGPHGSSWLLYVLSNRD